MKIAVIGALGQLGSDICDLLQDHHFNVTKLDVEDLDISKIDQVNAVLNEIKPEIIINTAAFHHVEKCEENPVLAFEVNAIGSRNLALISNDLNAYLIHISTDYVFDGKKNAPYIETDRPVPLNVYGNTKLSGEQFIESIAQKYLVMRSSGLYGKSPCRAKGGLNFVNLMLKLAKERDEIRVVDHEILTPTSTLEIARQIFSVLKEQPVGLAHATAEGQCSWYEFAKTVFELAKVKTNLQIAGPNEFPAKVPRPFYSVLENNFLKSIEKNTFVHWKEALKEYLTTF